MVSTHAGAPVPPTLDEVAKAAGVSRATASRAINGGERVSPAARRAVLDAVRELSYRPNHAARSLVTRRTDAIAVVIPETDVRLFTDPFFASILHGVTTALNDTDLQVMLLMAKRGEGSDRMLRYLGSGHTDGAIVVSHHRNDRIAEFLSAAALPSVFVGRPWSPESTVPYVDVDNHGGAARATGHLIARGARRIGTVSGPADMSAAVDRLAGWREALRAAGLPDDAVEHGDFTASGGAQAAARLLDRHPDLDGVFIASDLMAAAALPVIIARGRRVPEDLPVVGFDDSDVARDASPALTTVTNSGGALASRAVGMLLDQLEGRGIPTSVRLPSELVIRASA